MYIALKILHVAAVVVFLGNLVTGILWKLHGDQTKDPVIIRHTIAGLIRADRWFTIPGVVLILIGGFGAALIGGLPLLRTRWILAGIILFAISGLAYTRQVVPLQRQMLAVASSGVEGGGRFDWDKYRMLTRRWNVWGTIALIAPVLAMIGMIAKP
jgi:uncharacterized membrane protein